MTTLSKLLEWHSVAPGNNLTKDILQEIMDCCLGMPFIILF